MELGYRKENGKEVKGKAIGYCIDKLERRLKPLPKNCTVQPLLTTQQRLNPT